MQSARLMSLNTLVHVHTATDREVLQIPYSEQQACVLLEGFNW